jgi:hypothetical protein
MELNEKKTEIMVITKKKEGEIPTCQIIVNGTLDVFSAGFWFY